MEKIALVTGSSRGIGRAVAAELARQGWAVCINYRLREDCARSLLEQLTAEGCRAMMVQADVSQQDQVTAMVRQVEETFGPVSLLVNNAGVAGQALFQDITPEEAKRLLRYSDKSLTAIGSYLGFSSPASAAHAANIGINTCDCFRTTDILRE